jgi:hypothetical protein
MNNEIKKVINLVKKTGDRLIVLDPNDTNYTYVVMPLDEYERLVIGRSEVRNLTEDELLDKINRDIAIWKSEQEIEDFNTENTNSREEKNYFSKVDEIINYPLNSSNNNQKDKKKSKGFWSIPKERKEKAEEIIEEDRQYLENIDY